MDSSRRYAVIAGVLFIVATAATFAADALIPALTGTDYLTRLTTQTDQVAAGVLIKLVSVFAGAGIAVAMYPVMKRANAGLALGSVVFRTLEASFYMVGVLSLLALGTLGQRFATAGAVDQASLQAAADSWVAVRGYAAPLLGVFAFCVGASMYYVLFFRSRLVPRWLSGAGIAAILLLMAACVLSLFSGDRITSYIALAAPIAVQELVLAVWLIAKGFNPSAIASAPARPGSSR